MTTDARYEIILPLVGQFLLFWPDIYSLLLTNKHWKQIIYMFLPEIHYCKPTDDYQRMPIFSDQFRNIFKATFRRLSSTAFAELANRFRSIKEITFQDCLDNPVFLLEPQQEYQLLSLRKLAISQCCISYLKLVEKSSLLHTLVINNTRALNDDFISLIQQHCPSLQQLLVRKSFFVVNPLLLVGDESSPRYARLSTLVLQECPNLKSIEVRGGGGVYSSLRSLNASSTGVLPEEVQRYPQLFPALEELVLKNCWQLTSLNLSDAPRLRQLSLCHCRRLTALDLALPRLELLHLSLCSSLRQLTFHSTLFELRELRLLMLKDLRRVSLAGPAATSSPLQHPRLTAINLCGCQSFGQLDDDSSDGTEGSALAGLLFFQRHRRRLGELLGETEAEGLAEDPLTACLLDWLLELRQACPSLDWRRFWAAGVGGSPFLSRRSVLEKALAALAR